MEPSTEKRAEILDAAMRLFSSQGFERTTVEEIAARANVGKGTVYLYFANKEEIFFSVLETGLAAISKVISERLAAPIGFQARLEELVHTYLKFISDHREFYRIFLKERLNLNISKDNRNHDRLMLIHDQMNQVIADFFSLGIRDGFLRRGDPAQFAMALTGIVSHFGLHWLLDEESGPLIAQTPIILDLFLNGVKN